MYVLLGKAALVPGRELGQDNVTVGLCQLMSSSHRSENKYTVCKLMVNPFLCTWLSLLLNNLGDFYCICHTKVSKAEEQINGRLYFSVRKSPFAFDTLITTFTIFTRIFEIQKWKFTFMTSTDLFVFCSRMEEYFSIYQLQECALRINFRV